MAVLTLKLFISSPGDVEPERLLARRVLERLENEFGGDVILTPVVWEDEPLRATGHFQEEITHPADTDILICILWSRLGTPLPIDKFRRPDGTGYDSGTQWEFEQAVQSWQERQQPYLLVYRKDVDVRASISDDEEYEEKRRQKRALDAFWQQWFGGADEAFRRAFHTFQSSDQFQDILEIHLRKLIRDRLPSHLTADTDAPAPRSWPKGRGSPYRGLEAFDVEHAPIFFGRAKAISEIKQRLLHQDRANSAFVLVFGMSGCGKSSVVRAGVLPALVQPGAIEGIDVWRWCIFRPSDGAGDLFEGLAGALLGEEALPELETMGFGAPRLAEFLREAPRLALAPIEAVLKHAAHLKAEQQGLARASGAKLVVVVDQMEELFTLPWADDPQRIGIVAVLSELARSGPGTREERAGVWVIGTMRNDFYPHCAQIPALRELKEGMGQYDLPPPDSGEIRQMICYPAIAAGLSFERHRNSKIGLDDELLEAAVRNRQALPLLEFTLDELYKQRTQDDVLTLAAYGALGGLEGALSKRADEALASLEKPVQAALPALLRELATIGEGEGNPVVAQRAPLADLASTPEREALLEAFLKARLLVADLVTDREGERRVVGAAHEALLRDWPTARSLLEKDREFLRVREYLTELADRWQKEGASSEYLLQARKDLAVAEDLLERRQEDLDGALVEFIKASERRAARARIRRRLGVALAFTVVSGFSLFSFRQWKTAERLTDTTLQTIAGFLTTTDSFKRMLVGVPERRSAPLLAAIYETNLDLLGRLPDVPNTSRSKATNHQHLADLYLRNGQTAKAVVECEQCLAIARKLARETGRAVDQLNLAVFDTEYGSALREEGDIAGALAAYQESVQICRRLAVIQASNKVREALWFAYLKIGDLQFDRRHTQEAAAAYRQVMELALMLARDRQNVQAQRDLLASYERTGDVLKDEGQLPAAREAYEQSLRLAREVAESTGDDGDQRALTIISTKLAAFRQGLGESRNASAVAPRVSGAAPERGGSAR